MIDWLVRLAARGIPAAYRDEVLDDLRERERGWGLVRSVMRSARDTRRVTRLDRRGDSFDWRGGWRSAWTQVRRRPAASSAVAGILAVALGLNTGVLSLVRGVLLRPLPFAHAEHVVFIWTTSADGTPGPMAPARALDLWRRNPAVERGALIGHVGMTLTGDAAPERWLAASVSSTFFDTLGAQPLLGTVFHAGQPDRDVVVLSEALWTRRWNRDPASIGATVVLNGRARRIVGVMPRAFYWPSITPTVSAVDPPLLWACADVSEVPERPTPFDEAPDRDRRTAYVRLVARLATPMPAARASTTQTARTLAAEYPETDGGLGAALVPAREQMFGPVERPMLFIWLASALVVLAASVNVGNLILVRAAGRRREFAVRSALGASRGHLTWQLIAEGVLIAAAGGTVGIGVGAAVLRLFVAIAPESVGRVDTVSIDGWVVGAAIGIALATGMALGVIAAAALWRDRTATTLRASGGMDSGASRLRSALIVAEVALAMLLLAGAALFGSSLVRLERVDVGFDTHRLLTFNLAMPADSKGDAARQIEYFDRVVSRLRTVPGVTAAGAAVTLPIGGDDFGARLYRTDRPFPDPTRDRRLGYQVVEPGWFETLRVPMFAGRDFTAADDGTRGGVVIVNRALADALWPDRDAVGAQVRLSKTINAPALTVIGVVGNVLHNGPAGAARPEFYRPFRQQPFSFMAIALRTAIDEMRVVPDVRAAVAEIDPREAVSGVSAMDTYLGQAYGRSRFLAWLTGIFGAIALGLATLGVYGVASFSVSQRVREFGVRTALGSTPGRLVRDVLGRGLRPVAAGVVIGLIAAVGIAQTVTALLFGTAPMDPAAYLAAIAMLLGAAALGAWRPARRAARLDPVRALRDDV